MTTLGLLLLTACVPDFPDLPGELVHADPNNDFDGDGYTENGGDCDDRNADVFPSNIETCDLIDNDCNELIDDVLASELTAFYPDRDGDGFGDPSYVENLCLYDAPEGYLTNAGDCNDTLSSVYPHAPEICNGADDDCDGEIDEECTGEGTFYVDIDGDGYGGLESVQATAIPDGHAWNSGDCDDDDYRIYPGAVEFCDGFDNDCDGLVDGADPDLAGDATWYLDADEDGYGDKNQTITSCSQPDGYALAPGDCDDDDATMNPGAAEICDEDDTDEDCDGRADDFDLGEVDNRIDYFFDLDLDGYGDDNRDPAAFCDPPSYTAPSGGDCDDSDSAIHPGHEEICDKVDNNCDGAIDEGVLTTYYTDADSDGYGDPDLGLEACSHPSGYATNNEDCDDTNDQIHPSGEEVCDTVDNDCDESVDEEVTVTWYRDLDGDGYGATSSTIEVCESSYNYFTGYVSDGTDCDDTNSSVNPGGDESCDTSFDDDCDGDTNNEDAESCVEFYTDLDGDGFGNSGDSSCFCSGSGGAGNYTIETLASEDCDDTDASVNPGAEEDCNTAADDDCNGDDNDEDAIDCTTWYVDYDGDGYGPDSSALCICTASSPYTTTDGQDCDDYDWTENPGDLTCGLHGDVSDADAEASFADVYGWPKDQADLDDDGIVDLVFADYTANSYDGAVFAYFDFQEGSHDPSIDADLVLEQGTGGYTGWISGGFDDITGDGIGDLAASAGSAFYLVSDPSNAQSNTLEDIAAARLDWSGNVDNGASLSPLGDIDGDGSNDLSVVYQGQAYVYYGPLTGTVSYTDYDIAISGVDYLPLGGDIDNDGTDDLVWVLDGHGAYMVYGPTSATTLSNMNADAWAQASGASVTGPHNIDGDDYADLALGYYGESDQYYEEGAASIFYGPLTGTHSADHQILGNDEERYFGSSVNTAGDLNGDGATELLVYSPSSSYPLALFYGPITATTADEADAEISCSSYACNATTAGDVNGDGMDDVVAWSNLTRHIFLGGY